MKFVTGGKKKLDQLLKKLQNNLERTLDIRKLQKKMQNPQIETTDNRWHLSEKNIETKDWLHQRVHGAKEKRQK